ncbi:MAG: hypothetical protein WD844_13590 [Thermoleophilaceae bacterium]
MTDGVNLAYETIDREHADKPAATRRQLVAGAAGVLGSMGLLSALPEIAKASHSVDPQELLNIAATAEVLATIVNTVGNERIQLDATTKANVEAAAREELIHYEVLTSSGVGGSELTKRIWVPDEVFASREGFLKTLVAGDQIFINAYLIGTTTFANDGNGRLARIAAEFMGAEAVHRALALQSLGVLGNDRAFMKYSQPEENRTDPFFPKAGFRRITTAVDYLKMAGFGFGEEGKTPGAFYEFDEVSRRTPNPEGVNTRSPR